MKLVTFGIDSQKDLIIQFPVFVKPYTQTKLTLKIINNFFLKHSIWQKRSFVSN